jgi:hypothetical protein
MTSHEYESDLGDYVDGMLAPERAAAVEAHLARCETCRAAVADFRTLRGVVSSLERRTPPAHVWTQIAASLNANAAPRRAWHVFASPAIGVRPMFAGAVMLLLLVGASWFSWREVTTVQSAQVAGRALEDLPEPAGNLEATEAMSTEIVHLEGIVKAGAEVLPGDTKAAYQENGAVIEHAIGQSRAALATEPTNNLAQQSLFDALRSKLALLQDMVALINEMRKGNQEGAARIVSGMEP